MTTKNQELDQANKQTNDPEFALKEFERWIKIKKIKDYKRQENAKNKFEDTIVNGIIDKEILIDEDGRITQKLIQPIKNQEDEVVLTELNYMPRIPIKLLNIKLKAVDPSDADKRTLAYISALTNVSMGQLGELDTEDHKVCQSIVMYFL